MINSLDDITADNIKAILKNAPIKTKQSGISIPMVKRYYTLLQEGSEAPAIKICDNIIVEGNHRYVSGILFGKPPVTSPTNGSHVWQSRAIVEWDNVNYDLEDWDR